MEELTYTEAVEDAISAIEDRLEAEPSSVTVELTRNPYGGSGKVSVKVPVGYFDEEKKHVHTDAILFVNRGGRVTHILELMEPEATYEYTVTVTSEEITEEQANDLFGEIESAMSGLIDVAFVDVDGPTEA